MQCYPFIHSSDTSAPPAEDLRLIRAADCPAQDIEWLWPEKIPIGKVTLLIGDPGTGKSLVALDIAARVSRGANWPDEVGPPSRGGPVVANDKEGSGAARLAAPTSSVLILSATDDLADTIRPRLDAAGADPRRVFFVPSIADLRDDFNQLRVAVNCVPNCRLIIVDPINAYVGPSDSHFQTVMRKVLAPLAQLAAEKRIAILAIAHLRKNDGPAIHRAAGSIGFVAAASSVWTVTRDIDQPGRHLFLPLKNNLGPTATGLAYSIEPRGKRGAARIAWHPDPIETSADTALGGREPTELNRARAWLRKTLADGPRAASDVTQEAAHHGFHARTLRRALHAINGQTQNRGPLEGWWWSLPETPNGPSAPGSAGGSPTIHATPTSTPGKAGGYGAPAPNNCDPQINTSDPQNPVPYCPLPEFSSDPHQRRTGRFSDQSPRQKANIDSPDPPTAQQSIAAINRLDRKRAQTKPNNIPKQPHPTTGNPILDEILDSLRQPLALNPAPKVPDS